MGRPCRRHVTAAALLLLAGCAGNGRPEGREGYFYRVRPPVAFEMMRDNPDMPILDLRRREEFEGALGHIHRARNVPLEQLEWRLSELGDLKETTFLVYCREGACAERGMEILLEHGFDNVLVMEGGIDAWLDGGFGTVGGSAGGVRATGMPPKPQPTGQDDGDSSS